jgi:flagella basal body P-ring formation protein FlgA
MVKHFDLQQGNGRFRAVVSVANAGFPVQDKIYTGQAYPSVAAIVPARAIERGATIVPEDLTAVRLPRSRVSVSAIEQAETAIGMAAKQRLIAGRPIRRGELEPPRLVERNGLVTIVYKSPGMVLRTKGRALADASLGQSVAIVNLQSKRTIEAEVTGTGLVSVSALPSPGPARPKRTVQQSNRGGGTNLHVIR